MRRASTQYKSSMKQALRNQGFAFLNIGIINLEAQENAYVDESTLLWSSGASSVFEEGIEKEYVTAEKDFATVDGSMYFPSADKVYAQGLISKDFEGEIEIQLGALYSLRGLTICFGHNFPTVFKITTDLGSIEYQNDAQLFQTEDIFENVSFIRITPICMKEENRLRVHRFICGLSEEIPAKKLQKVSVKSACSPIGANLPTVDMTVTVSNVDRIYDTDNPSSRLNFITEGQPISLVSGYMLNDGTIERLEPQKLYVKNASADDKTCVIKCVDILDKYNTTYHGGAYHEAGISLYELAIDVLEYMGLDSEEYYLDPYLKEVIVYNPIPVCKCTEALQIIANAGRCTLKIASDGGIQITANFTPVITAVADNEAAGSTVSNILSADKKNWYSYSSKNLSALSGYTFFPNHNTNIFSGYVSAQVSDDSGLYDVNPVVQFEMESRTTIHGMSILFYGNVPKRFVVRSYREKVLVYESEYLPEKSFCGIDQSFEDVDAITLEFVEAEANSRVAIEHVSFGSSTDYRLTRSEDLFSEPKGTRQDKLRSVSVIRTMYRKGSELKTLSEESAVVLDAEGCHTLYFKNPSHDFKVECDVEAEIVQSSAYMLKMKFITESEIIAFKVTGYEYENLSGYYRQNYQDTGLEKEWTNPLVSTPEHAAKLAEWIGDYYLQDVEYKIDYRGDPRIDANDTFYLERNNQDDALIRAHENTLTYDGTWSATMKARRI